MKKKTIGTLLALMTAVSFTACGTKETMVTEAVAMESNVTVTETTGLIVEDLPVEITPETIKTEEPSTKIYGSFVIFDEAQGEAVDIPLKDFYPLDGEYLLTTDIPLYYTAGKTAGYAKEGFTINVMDGNTEWLRFKNTEKKDYFTVDFLLVKVEELREATSVEVVTTQTVEPETESELLASAETTPVQETPATEKPKTETTKPATSKPVAEPSTAEPIAEPVVVESNKYTPEEAVAVYRSIMEANGIQWDPSIKEFASWGTGWIYLTKGEAERAGNSSVEAFRMGGGDSTHPWKTYYLEVTGSDENAVYITGWHCS